MPAFTFEKISSPVRTTTTPVAINAKFAPTDQRSDNKPRGLIAQMLDRFMVARIKRDEIKANIATPLKHHPPD